MNKEMTAVIVIDLQADFTEEYNGALAVPKTRRDYLLDVQKATESFKKMGYIIIATRDFHPSNHISFHTNHLGKQAFESIEIGGETIALWPPHCVQDTPGAEILLPDLLIDYLISKATDPNFESFSAFGSQGSNDTGLKKLLDELGVKKVVIYGLATDYCVKFSALDACRLGYDVQVLTDLSRGIAFESIQSAIVELRKAGAQVD